METSIETYKKYFEGKFGGKKYREKYIQIHVFSWYQKFYLPS